MQRRLPSLWLLPICLALGAAPALAGDYERKEMPPPGIEGDPEGLPPGLPEDLAREGRQLAREGVASMFFLLDHFLQKIPRFEAPEITEDGDIIIRRKRPGADDAPSRRPSPRPGEPEILETAI